MAYRKKNNHLNPGNYAPRQTAAKDGLWTRHCHDCGCKTTDYRCPACLEKWRRKNGVLVTANDEEGL